MSRVGWQDNALVTEAVLLMSLCFKICSLALKDKLDLLYKGHIYYEDTTLFTKYPLTF